MISQMNQLNSNTRNLLYAAYGLGTTLGTELPHSRLQENEADTIGLTYMARAGYDPEEAVWLFGCGLLNIINNRVVVCRGFCERIHLMRNGLPTFGS